MPVATAEITDPRVLFFMELNAEEKRAGRKTAWSERLKMIYEHFPSTCAKGTWNKALSDVDTLGELIRDILRLQQAEPGKSGPRPAPDPRKGIRTLRQITGQDYSVLSFREAFEVLANGYSLTHLARKTKLSRSQVYRLLRGECAPTPAEMKQIAEGFGKPPAYFTEFRTAFIVATLTSHLDAVPEATVGLYRKLLA